MGESETPGRLRGRPILWFALPMAVLVFVGASTPWIAQRVPRFLFPALAAAGAVLVVFLFVDSLVQFVRRHRGEGRLRFFAVAVNGVAAVFLVILPLTHLLRRSEEHTSELQSLAYLVCRLLLEKKKKTEIT